MTNVAMRLPGIATHLCVKGPDAVCGLQCPQIAVMPAEIMRVNCRSCRRTKTFKAELAKWKAGAS